MSDKDNKIPPRLPQRLVQGRDYYINDQGLMVLTREYLLARGYCCETGCTNCPYGFRRPGR